MIVAGPCGSATAWRCIACPYDLSLRLVLRPDHLLRNSVGVLLSRIGRLADRQLRLRYSWRGETEWHAAVAGQASSGRLAVTPPRTRLDL